MNESLTDLLARLLILEARVAALEQEGAFRTLGIPPASCNRTYDPPSYEWQPIKGINHGD